ncbi:hypothetical protein [Clostridium akagii]|uniref:hypothetical protein n=1 Tax=Clostridium akagii TaxID=91623 RepID=UPI00047A8ED7|nr:hypothetical protein [Clostridium akagii]
MRIVNEYIKGGNKASITENIHLGKIIYIAITASSSKIFKSLKGAEKYMIRFEYKKIIMSPKYNSIK